MHMLRATFRMSMRLAVMIMLVIAFTVREPCTFLLARRDIVIVFLARVVALNEIDVIIIYAIANVSLCRVALQV